MTPVRGRSRGFRSRAVGDYVCWKEQRSSALSLLHLGNQAQTDAGSGERAADLRQLWPYRVLRGHGILVPVSKMS